MKSAKYNQNKKLKIALELAVAQIKLEECDVVTVFTSVDDTKDLHSKNCRRCTTLKEIREVLK